MCCVVAIPLSISWRSLTGWSSGVGSWCTCTPEVFYYCSVRPLRLPLICSTPGPWNDVSLSIMISPHWWVTVAESYSRSEEESPNQLLLSVIIRLLTMALVVTVAASQAPRRLPDKKQVFVSLRRLNSTQARTRQRKHACKMQASLRLAGNNNCHYQTLFVYA